MPEPTPIFGWPVPLLTEVAGAPAFQNLAGAINDTIAGLLPGVAMATSMPGCSVVGGVGLVLAAGTFGTVTFDQAQAWDTDAMFLPFVNQDRIHMRRPGVVAVSAQMWNQSTGALWVEARVLRTGGAQPVLQRRTHLNVAGSTWHRNYPMLKGLVRVLPGDYLTLQVRSETAMTVSSTALMAQYVMYQGPHLNANPHFEVALTPWTSAGTTLFDRDNTTAKSGLWAARLRPTGAAATVQMESELIPVTPGWIYAITGNLNATATWASNSAAFAWKDSGGLPISTVAGPTISATGGLWQFMYANATAPAGAAFVRIQARSTGTPPNTTDFRWDEVYLVRTG